MDFTPRTEEEIKAMNLWPEGVYGFEILESATLGQDTVMTKDTQSKKGNDMIQLVVQVFNPEGFTRVVMDYVLEIMPGKLRSAAYASSLGEKYETGQLQASDFIGKTGNLKLVIQKGKAKDDGSGEFYSDRNSVADYMLGDTGHKVDPQAPADGLEDTIPF